MTHPGRTQRLFHFPRLVAAAFLLLALLSPALAADKKAKGAPSATPDDRVAFHGTVVAFDKTAGMFSLKSKKGLNVYVISDSTKMMKGTAAGTMDDIEPGAYVRGAARRRTTDTRFDALTVKIEPKSTAPPPRIEKATAVEPAPSP